MKNKDREFVGYFAFSPGTMNVFCHGDACIVNGSEETLRNHILKSQGRKKRQHIMKTRYGEIVRGLKMGAAYAFDKEAYERFYYCAKAEGYDVVEFRKGVSSSPEGGGMSLMRVQWVEHESSFRNRPPDA